MEDKVCFETTGESREGTTVCVLYRYAVEKRGTYSSPYPLGIVLPLRLFYPPCPSLFHDNRNGEELARGLIQAREIIPRDAASVAGSRQAAGKKREREGGKGYGGQERKAWEFQKCQAALPK